MNKVGNVVDIIVTALLTQKCMSAAIAVTRCKYINVRSVTL